MVIIGFRFLGVEILWAIEWAHAVLVLERFLLGFHRIDIGFGFVFDHDRVRHIF